MTDEENSAALVGVMPSVCAKSAGSLYREDPVTLGIHVVWGAQSATVGKLLHTSTELRRTRRSMPRHKAFRVIPSLLRSGPKPDAQDGPAYVFLHASTAGELIYRLTIGPGSLPDHGPLR